MVWTDAGNYFIIVLLGLHAFTFSRWIFGAKIRWKICVGLWHSVFRCFINGNSDLCSIWWVRASVFGDKIFDSMISSKVERIHWLLCVYWWAFHKGQLFQPVWICSHHGFHWLNDVQLFQWPMVASRLVICIDFDSIFDWIWFFRLEQSAVRLYPVFSSIILEHGIRHFIFLAWWRSSGSSFL